MLYEVITVLVLAGAIACKNDIEYIQSLSAVEDLPIQTGKNFETFYSDSAKLQVIFMAPKVERYLKKGDVITSYSIHYTKLYEN